MFPVVRDLTGLHSLVFVLLQWAAVSVWADEDESLVALSLLQVTASGRQSSSASWRASSDQPGAPLKVDVDRGLSMMESDSDVDRGEDRKPGLHSVVGIDGVLMIHIDRSEERSNYTRRQLSEAGIFPRKLLGTDAYAAEEEVLEKACPLHRDGPVADPNAFCKTDEHRDKHSSDYRPGGGCKDKTEQAIVDSHRRALLQAAEREAEWTAILEDDAVPVRPEAWSESFLQAWGSVPDSARVVRLGWCTFREEEGPKMKKPAIYKSIHGAKDADFELIDWMTWGKDFGYRVGGCTTAYMVHKSAIPEILNIFPCCCAIDCCLEYGLYYKERPGEIPRGRTRGMEMMVSMDAKNSTEYASSLSSLEQSGILVQDNRLIDSERE